MRYASFGAPLELVALPDPNPPPDGVVVKVEATGMCRSDWHGWMGHDADIRPPHVPGHELAGTVAAVGPAVRKWKIGDRVTTPFCLGCGRCAQCEAGQSQICDRYYQPGFTGWGSFAEYVALPYADENLVALPPSLSFVAAALLGCRFATAYRAVVTHGRLEPGEWIAVHACGGVGLSALMIARALGGRVVAVDVTDDKLALATRLGAEIVVNAARTDDVARAVRHATGGDGVHVSIDALGSVATCLNSLGSLRKRGRHVQVGLMTGEHSSPPIAMGPVIARELEIRGSHGMPARDYPELLALITSGRLSPEALVGRTIPLSDVPAELPRMGVFEGVGVTVINRF
ncbi:MAG TPA: zinc-dependent alcohol dehydrogenase family protein [Gemmatimonadales bacterium]|nr:zinc-dependent alcohol dehydrogenase family protein [Gemmatimonadales bacterium]